MSHAAQARSQLEASAIVEGMIHESACAPEHAPHKDASADDFLGFLSSSMVAPDAEGSPEREPDSEEEPQPEPFEAAPQAPRTPLATLQTRLPEGSPGSCLISFDNTPMPSAPCIAPEAPIQAPRPAPDARRMTMRPPAGDRRKTRRMTMHRPPSGKAGADAKKPHERELERKQAEIERQRGLLADKDAKLRSAIAEKSQLSSELVPLKRAARRAEQLEGEVKKLREQVSDIRAVRKQAETQRRAEEKMRKETEATRRKFETLDGAAKKFSKKCKALAERVAALEGDAEKKTARIEALRERLRGAEAHAARAEVQHNRAALTGEELRAALAGEYEEHALAVEALANAEEEGIVVTARAEKLAASLAAAEAELERARKAELAAAEGREAHRRDAEKLRESKAAQRAKIEEMHTQLQASIGDANKVQLELRGALRRCEQAERDTAATRKAQAAAEAESAALQQESGDAKRQLSDALARCQEASARAAELRQELDAKASAAAGLSKTLEDALVARGQADVRARSLESELRDSREAYETLRRVHDARCNAAPVPARSPEDAAQVRTLSEKVRRLEQACAEKDRRAAELARQLSDSEEAAGDLALELQQLTEQLDALKRAPPAAAAPPAPPAPPARDLAAENQHAHEVTRLKARVNGLTDELRRFTDEGRISPEEHAQLRAEVTRLTKREKLIVERAQTQCRTLLERFKERDAAAARRRNEIRSELATYKNRFGEIH
eukprot:gnl/Chilomastix_cuspidata/3607.p1 GENE.gnl/Chilomastix_cuspidata/3607~~gnl/Chilomastix_cuspidata/3607.p1  ORF type:complete len:732 (+),score=435.86 gnl/Chilomastix_cuspidata/3607:508-2703(+)